MKVPVTLLLTVFVLSAVLLMTGCSNQVVPASAGDNDVNRELAVLMDYYGQAVNGTSSAGADSALVGRFAAYLKSFDEKYDSALSADFDRVRAETEARLSGGSSWPALTDLPFNTDGAVYLSGGTDGVLGSILTYISPTATAGKYYHGGALDLDRFDPTNLDVPSVETAVTKGAGYETAMDWMKKVNVTVLNPKNILNRTALNSAQSALDFYCRASNTNMQYGFFHSYVDIFSVTTKDDNYYWYCTKVVWRIYKLLGMDLDTNTTAIDWTKSGVYGTVKALYYARYFYNWSLAEQKIAEYINYLRTNLVLAEEIYFSPYLTKCYEKVRE